MANGSRRTLHERSPTAAGGADAGSRLWRLLVAAAQAASDGIDVTLPARYALGAGGALERVPQGDPRSALAWDPASGWRSELAHSRPERQFLDLYLPVCSAHAGRPLTIGHLGQSLDGFIATPSGDSQFVTGHEDIVHLHRLRALCDAVVVGAGTVAADDPRLTTRLVAGKNPLRVIIDPACRLATLHRVFSDGAARTLRACAAGAVGAATPRPDERLEVRSRDGRLDLAELVGRLRARGCARILIEGGGVTVSAFLESGLLDRLHVTIAPLIIGEGRPAIRIPAHARLCDCARPQRRVFRMGEDILFDCDLRARTGAAGTGERVAAADGSSVRRVI